MSRLLRLAPVLLLLALAAAVIFSGAARQASLSGLAAHHAALATFVARRPVEALGLFVLADVLVVSACIPGPGAMGLAAGLLFGVAVGGLASLAAATAGSVIVYLACRVGFAGLAPRGGAAARITAMLRENAFSTLLTLRLMPVAPMAAINIGAGLARAPFRDFLLTALLGGAPPCFVLAAVGAGLGPLLAHGGRLQPAVLLQPRVVVPLLVLAALSAGPMIVRLARARRA